MAEEKVELLLKARDEATKQVDPNAGTSGCAGGGWLEVSPDDQKLYRVVIGRNPGTLPKVLMIGILTIALAEAIAIFGLIFAFQGR